MKLRQFAPVLLVAALTVPAGAQERRERVERERVEIERAAPRAWPTPRVLALTRSPRAVLGITTSSTTDLQDTLGVHVDGVTADGPAARAGIAEGARLQAIDGVSLRIGVADAQDPIVRDLGARRLTRELGKKAPGDEVELRVLAGNQSRTVRVRLADSDSLYLVRVTAARRPMVTLRAALDNRASLANRASLGIQVGSTGSRRDTLGVFVTNAYDDGPAAKAGIIEGSRIASINGVDLRVAPADAEDHAVARSRVQRLMRELADVKPGDDVELRVWSNGQYRTSRVRTVPSDSLRRNRSMMIFGEGFNFEGGPLMSLPRGHDDFEGRPLMSLPRGPDMGVFRMEMSPSFHGDIEAIVGDALHGARGALTEAHHALEAARRVTPPSSVHYH